MTLANGLWTEDAVHIWSDTAWWRHAMTPLRCIEMHAAKIILGEQFPWALINTGTAEGLGAIASALDSAQPRDWWQLRECLLGVMAGIVGKTSERALIASYDDKPRLTLIDTEGFHGHPPLTVMELRPFQICSNGHRPETMRLIEAGVTVESMADIIRAQAHDWDHDEGALIAGTIGRATVTRECVKLVEVDELPEPVAAERVAWI